MSSLLTELIIGLLGFFLIEGNMKRFFQMLVFCVSVSQVYAVGEAGAIFLLIAPGAGPAGTGEAQVAKVDDAYASYYNPAGLGFLQGSEVAGMHVNWLPNLADDIYYDFLAYRKELSGIGSLGMHIILNLGSQFKLMLKGMNLATLIVICGHLPPVWVQILAKALQLGRGKILLQQNLGPGAGAEDNEGSSTDFLFDVGYLKKYSFGIWVFQLLI